jgi:hypothetical protein
VAYRLSDIDGGKAQVLFAMEDVHKEHDAFIAVIGDEYCFQVGEAACSDDDSIPGLKVRYARRVARETLADYLDNFVLYWNRTVAAPHEPDNAACRANGMPVVV